jgi:hypothetical protein
MIALLFFFLILLVSPLKSKSRLEAENAALRHQLIVLRRKVRGRVHARVYRRPHRKKLPRRGGMFLPFPVS